MVIGHCTTILSIIQLVRTGDLQNVCCCIHQFPCILVPFVTKGGFPFHFHCQLKFFSSSGFNVRSRLFSNLQCSLLRSLRIPCIDRKQKYYKCTGNRLATRERLREAQQERLAAETAEQRDARLEGPREAQQEKLAAETLASKVSATILHRIRLNDATSNDVPQLVE